MEARATELANLCVLFPALRVGRINHEHLEALVQRTMAIDSQVPAREVIEQAITWGLMFQDGDECTLSRTGKELARRQSQIDVRASPAAREYILKSAYLNPEMPTSHCCRLLLGFSVDAIRGTFVFHRSEVDDLEIRSALRLLSGVGYLDIEGDTALVRQEYVGLTNSVLQILRLERREYVASIDAEANEIGAVAEERALADETRRLTDYGYPELAKLVQQISRVDNSAGYDVLSYCGTGPNPTERRLIEVKGTRGDEIGFVWTRNERSVASKAGAAYWIYVYTSVDTEQRTAIGPTLICDPCRSLSALGYRQEPLDVFVSNSKRTLANQ